MHINQALADEDSAYQAATEIVAYQDAIDRLTEIAADNILARTNLNELIKELAQNRDLTARLAAPTSLIGATRTTAEQDKQQAAYEEGYDAGFIDGHNNHNPEDTR